MHHKCIEGCCVSSLVENLLFKIMCNKSLKSTHIARLISVFHFIWNLIIKAYTYTHYLNTYLFQGKVET